MVRGEFLMDFHLIPFHGSDFVLRVQWLQGLGPTLFDYEKLDYLSIVGQGGLHLQAYRRGAQPRCQWINFPVKYQGGISYLYQLEHNPIVPEQPPLSSQYTESSFQQAVIDLLRQYADVFAQPKGFPVTHDSDHQIALLPDTKLVNGHPYKYPHFHKAEIKSLVQEMVDKGIIQPSRSPFSSLILPIQKKNGSWNFCVDNRALNVVKD